MPASPAEMGDIDANTEFGESIPSEKLATSDTIGA
tara:strand:+ start:20604 stop:20708 length:105 start_codon:yes stop_codon:yes gene_type:complete